VTAYAVGLKRALINILTNAEQASPPGGTIHARTRREAAWGVVEIEDEGPGIPKAHHKRVFEMFFSTRPGGTGLGLPLARAAVESSGGTLAVSTGARGGACLSIRLPLAAGAGEGADLFAAGGAAPAARTAGGGEASERREP
jgi:signal transduction histidine kinase